MTEENGYWIKQLDGMRVKKNFGEKILPKKIRHYIDADKDFDISGDNDLYSLIKELEEIKNKFPDEQVFIKIYTYDGDDEVYTGFYYEKLETEEEVQKRVDEEKRREEEHQRWTDQREKAEYERLRKKFEARP